jgi:hypothetical protein
MQVTGLIKVNLIHMKCSFRASDIRRPAHRYYTWTPFIFQAEGGAGFLAVFEDFEDRGPSFRIQVRKVFIRDALPLGNIFSYECCTSQRAARYRAVALSSRPKLPAHARLRCASLSSSPVWQPVFSYECCTSQRAARYRAVALSSRVYLPVRSYLRRDSLADIHVWQHS